MTVSKADLERHLAELSARVTDPRAGLYGPRSISWEVNKEGILMLGGGCAALLQLAQGLAEEVAAPPRVHLGVVVVGLDPVDLLDRDEAHPAGVADGHPVEVARGRRRGGGAGRQG